MRKRLRYPPFIITVAVAIVGVVAMIVLSACGSNQRDLEGIPLKEPDKVEIYANLDDHPNIVRICVGGIAFATTSRDYNAIMRVPEWDRWCDNVAE